ncbi:hypothetical protein B7494_g2231 [Chlorociboria aeruginascens]|nr:hypothetical protein B7494_g2231 [Chlorociboria aeruginascens]
MATFTYPTPPPTSSSSPKPAAIRPRVSAQDSYFYDAYPASPAMIPSTNPAPGPFSYDPAPPSFFQTPTSASNGYGYGKPTININNPYSPFPGKAKPRPGLLRRIALKIRSLVRKIKLFVKRHPIWMGIATFLPVLLSVGFIRGWKGLGLSGKGKGKVGEKIRERKGFWSEVMKGFGGFGGSKGGALEGMLKVLQMAV